MATQRAPAEANRLFNPGFLAGLITNVTVGFQEEHDSGMPPILAFIGSPLVLYREAREALPLTTKTSMTSFVERNRPLRLTFPERAKALTPFVRQGLLVALAVDLVEMDQHGLSSPRNDPIKTTKEVTDEVTECYKRAHFVGRWFAKVGSHSTVAMLWGVRV